MSRFRIAVALDVLVLGLLIAAAAIARTGGFYTEIGGVAISARGAGRPLLAGLALLLVRLSLDRRIGPLGTTRAMAAALRDRLFDRAADQNSRGHERLTVRHTALAALGFILVGGFLLQAQLRQMDSVPDLGDPLFSIWRMGWLFHQLQGDPRPLFDGNIFYPERLTLTFSDSMLLPSLTAAPLFAAGLHPVVAYNVLFLSCFLMSALTTFVLVGRVTGSATAAFIGGLLYGFYPYRFEHYSHLELQVTYWMPLALVAVVRYAETLRVHYAVAAALCAVAQLYSSMYYGVFFSLYAAVVLGVLMLLSRPPLRRLLVPLVAACAVGGVLAIPLARPYLAAQGIKGERDVKIVTYYSAVPTDYLRADARSALYGRSMLPGRQPERALFPGVTPLALTLVALAPPLGAMRLAFLGGLVFAFDMSLGFNGFSYPLFYEWFLPIRGMRVPARFSIVLAISLAVLGGFGARRLLARCRSPLLRRLVFAALTIAIAVDFRPLLDLRRVWPEPPPVYGLVAGNTRVVLAEFPFRHEIPYLYFSLWHWASLLNGYSGFSPPHYAELQEQLADFPGPSARQTLKERGVTHVTVNCGLYRSGCEELLERVAREADFRVVAEGRWQGRQVRLYELARQ